ncbi:hypothetical protein CR513_19101, partial [Mucuna pruriens]
MIDAASGGALMDKTSVATIHMISNMASNTQQFGIRGAITNKAVNEVGSIDNLRMENQLIELMSLVRQLVVCGICTSVEHLIDMCPTLQETVSDNIWIHAEHSSPESVPLSTAENEISHATIPTSMEEWMEFQQNMNATMHDLKMQIGQLANLVSQLQSAGSGNLPSQPILNPKGGNMSDMTLRSGK